MLKRNLHLYIGLILFIIFIILDIEEPILYLPIAMSLWIEMLHYIIKEIEEETIKEVEKVGGDNNDK